MSWDLPPLGLLFVWILNLNSRASCSGRLVGYRSIFLLVAGGRHQQCQDLFDILADFQRILLGFTVGLGCPQYG